MSFIVIWLHFFLQAENRGKALPQKPQTLPLITLIYTDQRNPFNFGNPLMLGFSPRLVVGVSFGWRRLQIAEGLRLLLGCRWSFLFRDRVIDDDLLHALIGDNL